MTTYRDIDNFAAGGLSYGTFNPGPTSADYGRGFTNLSAAGIPSCGDAQAVPAVVSLKLTWDEIQWPGGNERKSLETGDVVEISLERDTTVVICAGHVPKPPNGQSTHVPVAVSGVIEVSTEYSATGGDNRFFNYAPLGGGDLKRLGRLLMPINGHESVLVYVTGPFHPSD